MMKPVKDTESKDKGTENGKHNEFKRADRVDDKGCAFIEKFQGLCNPGFDQVAQTESRKCIGNGVGAGRCRTGWSIRMRILIPARRVSIGTCCRTPGRRTIQLLLLCIQQGK